jgi:hypothetical protein
MHGRIVPEMSGCCKNPRLARVLLGPLPDRRFSNMAALYWFHSGKGIKKRAKSILAAQLFVSISGLIQNFL